MDIVPFYFRDKDGIEGVVGLHAQNEGLPKINLFAVEENRDGPSVSDNIYLISKQVSEAMFDGRDPLAFQWTFSAGGLSTHIDFSTTSGEVYKLDFSNKLPINFERQKHPGYVCSIEGYEAKPLFEDKRDIIDEDWDQPAHVYAIPCKDAPGGLFYMESEYPSLEREGQFETVLVSTEKLIEKLREDCPRNLEHAAYKFGNANAQDWLDGEANSIGAPMSCGHFGYPRGHLEMCAGDAEVLMMVQGLNLPYIPITVPRSDAAQIKKDIGYGYDGLSINIPISRPLYEN